MRGLGGGTAGQATGRPSIVAPGLGGKVKSETEAAAESEPETESGSLRSRDVDAGRVDVIQEFARAPHAHLLEQEQELVL